MPELPEVETIRRALRDGGRDGPPLIGRCILAAHLLWERTLATPSSAAFQPRIVGQIIRDVGRRGKFILLELSRDVLLIHLRMSGDLLVEPCDAPLAPHHRLVLDLDGGLRLAFNDPRKFGRAWLVSDPMEILGGLGPEPLSLELTAQDFYERLRFHRRQLKPLLLDQSFLAGLGNIYADEALHLARLHPLTIASQLDQAQADRLLVSIRQVLEDGIHRQGASIDWVYRGGDFQNYFHVYQRTGEACANCGTPIQRIIVGQRGTHFCPACQPSTTNS
jgi:formamidopyrimidine-DNA glycosylase